MEGYTTQESPADVHLLVPEWFLTLSKAANKIQLTIAISMVAGNAATLLVIILARRLHTVSNQVLGSLAFADFMVGVTQITTRMQLLLNVANSSCIGLVRVLITSFVPQLPIMVSVTHILVIATERYIAIFCPLRYSSLWTTGRVRGLLLAAWGFNIVYIFAGAIWDLADSSLPLQCHNASEITKIPYEHLLFAPMVQYIVEGALVVVIYAKIFHIARKQKKVIKAMQSVAPTGMEYAGVKPKARGNNLFYAIIIMYFSLWGPFLVVSTVGYIVGPSVWQVTSAMVTGLLVSTNFTVNSFIYAWRSSEFRICYKLLCLGRLAELRNG